MNSTWLPEPITLMHDSSTKARACTCRTCTPIGISRAWYTCTSRHILYSNIFFLIKSSCLDPLWFLEMQCISIDSCDRSYISLEFISFMIIHLNYLGFFLFWIYLHKLSQWSTKTARMVPDTFMVSLLPDCWRHQYPCCRTVDVISVLAARLLTSSAGPVHRLLIAEPYWDWGTAEGVRLFIPGH